MKILHVIPSIGPARGGPSFVLRSLARGLAAAGFSVEVATTDDNGAARSIVPPVQREGGVTFRYFTRQSRFYIFSAPLTRWLWSNVQHFDIVHIHTVFSYCSTAAAFIARCKGVPYVIRPLGVLNGWGMKNRRPFLKRLSFRLIERRLLEHAAVVHYTSEQERIEAESLGFYAPAVIISNPVDLPKTAESAGLRERFPELRGKEVFLFLSRLDPKKGLDLLIPAFANVHRRHPNTALVIAGDGPEPFVSALKALALKHQVKDALVWMGFVAGAQKLGALAESDVFVLPSYSENFGVAAVEAMSCGLPLVVSDQVGIHCDVKASGAGLVTQTSIESVTSALECLVGNAPLRMEMARRGKEFAASVYSLQAVSSKLAALYSDLSRDRDNRNREQVLVKEH